MSISQSMFPISSNSISYVFYSWVIIIFISPYHSSSTVISTASGYKCFKKESYICVFIFLTLYPPRSIHDTGHKKVLSLLLELQYIFSFQASNPHFLVIESNLFPFRRFLVWNKFSYCVIPFNP